MPSIRSVFFIAAAAFAALTSAAPTTPIDNSAGSAVAPIDSAKAAVPAQANALSTRHYGKPDTTDIATRGACELCAHSIPDAFLKVKADVDLVVKTCSKPSLSLNK
jgi:hypothetical protein